MSMRGEVEHQPDSSDPRWDDPVMASVTSFVNLSHLAGMNGMRRIRRMIQVFVYLLGNIDIKKTPWLVGKVPLSMRQIMLQKHSLMDRNTEKSQATGVLPSNLEHH